MTQILLLEMKERYSKQQAQGHEASGRSDTNTNIKNRHRLIKWQVGNAAKISTPSNDENYVFRTAHVIICLNKQGNEKKP